LSNKGKLLYIGDLSLGGTCVERMRALEDYGYSVVSIDQAPYLNDLSRYLRSFEHRLLDGPGTRKLNADILKTASLAIPEIIWIDKGRSIFPSTVAKLKNMYGAFSVHYTPDPCFSVHQSRHLNASLGYFDLCITNKRYEIDEYVKKGAKEVIFVFQGIDKRFQTDELIHCNDPHGSMFIGHCEPYYINILKYVATVDNSLRIHGAGWTKSASSHPGLRKHIESEGVWGDLYPRTLSTSKIGIGLLCKRYPDQFTTRSFEIPAAGSMLIAERTDEHSEIFIEDEEAVFFSTKVELKHLLHKYHGDEAARSRIALAGQKKVREYYSWSQVLRPAVEYIENFR